MNHALETSPKREGCYSVCLESLSVFLVVGCFHSSLTQLRRLEELDLGNNEIYSLVSVYPRDLLLLSP